MKRSLEGNLERDFYKKNLNLGVLGGKMSAANLFPLIKQFHFYKDICK